MFFTGCSLTWCLSFPRVLSLLECTIDKDEMCCNNCHDLLYSVRARPGGSVSVDCNAYGRAGSLGSGVSLTCDSLAKDWSRRTDVFMQQRRLAQVSKFFNQHKALHAALFHYVHGKTGLYFLQVKINHVTIDMMMHLFSDCWHKCKH